MNIFRTPEYYTQIIYRPAAINRLDDHEMEASRVITEKIGERMKEIESIILPTINRGFKKPYENIKYRIVNVASVVDPRVSTDPGLNSIIQIAHIAYWFEKKGI